MTKRKTTTKPKRAPARRVTPSKTNIAKALKDLGIDKPYYTARVVGGRLELRLYGGEVVFWPANVETSGSDVSGGDT